VLEFVAAAEVFVRSIVSVPDAVTVKITLAATIKPPVLGFCPENTHVEEEGYVWARAVLLNKAVPRHIAKPLRRAEIRGRP